MLFKIHFIAIDAINNILRLRSIQNTLIYTLCFVINVEFTQLGILNFGKFIILCLFAQGLAEIKFNIPILLSLQM